MPPVGSSKPAIIRSIVVLPEPDGPSIEKNSPSAMSRSTPATAVTSPKRLVTPRSDTAVPGTGNGSSGVASSTTADSGNRAPVLVAAKP